MFHSVQYVFGMCSAAVSNKINNWYMNFVTVDKLSVKETKIWSFLWFR